MEALLRQWVLEAAERPQVIARIAEVYAQLQMEVDRRRPICLVSGRCCRFDEYGHQLFVTTMELAAFIGGLRQRPGTAVSNQLGGCPFQVGKLCGVHTIRPLGCRIFYCDASATQWQQDIYERFHGQIRRLHEELDVPYSYIEWRKGLAAVGLQAPNPGQNVQLLK